MDPLEFPCGHPRIPENFSTAKDQDCKTCCRRRAKERKTHFKCGHPVKDNVRWSSDHRVRRCAICTAEPIRARPRFGFEMEPPTAAPTTIKLYHPRDYAPRPLPIRDGSGRSYSLAPARQSA